MHPSAPEEPWAIRYGLTEPPPPRIALRAGPLTLAFEDGDLRQIALGAVEVLRRIYVMVRDHAWNTFPGRIARIEQDIGADRFRIAYTAEHRGMIEGAGELAYDSEVVLAGDPDGRITVAFSGRNRIGFDANRVGICVLHGPGYAATPVEISRVDGARDRRVFPRLILPTEPFTDIAAMAFAPRAGLPARLEFQGAVFETEDQRTFGDASFKTFSTPLRMPRPVRVAADASHRQQVSLTVGPGGRAAERAWPIQRAAVRVGEPLPTPMPRIGIGVGARALAAEEAELIRALAPAHLHIALRPCAPGWAEALARASATACAIAAPLEAMVVVPEGATAAHLGAISELAARASALEAQVGAWILVSESGVPSDAFIAAALARLAQATPGALRGAGGWLSYCMLTNNRPDATRLDLLSFSMDPQGHAMDPTTVMENIGAVGAGVAGAQSLAGTAGVAVSPLRFMPRADQAANNPRRARDPRHSALFGAAWTLGALSQAALAGAARVSVAEAVGPEGVLAEGVPGRQVHPLFHVLAVATALAGATPLETVCARPTELAALAVATRHGVELLAANLRPEPATISLQGPWRARLVRQLDERSAAEALAQPLAWRRSGPAPAASGTAELTLPPYALARWALTRV